MHRLLLGLSLLFAAATAPRAQSQTELQQLVPSCGGPFDTCGFADRISKVDVIPKRFERVGRFEEGLAPVRLEEKWGFVDETGTLVIAPRFDAVGGFYMGLAEIVVGTHAGVIDRTGRTIVEPRFKRAMPFTKDVIVYVPGEQQKGIDQRPVSFRHELSLNYTQRFGLLHIMSGTITGPDFHMHIFERLGRGLIWSTRGDPLKGPHGLLQADGKWRLEPQFEHVSPLSEDRAVVRVPAAGAPPFMSGAVDPEGRVIIPLERRGLVYFKDGFSWSGLNGKQGLIDSNGNLIGGRWFDWARAADKGGPIGKVSIDGVIRGLAPDGRIVENPDNGEIAVCANGVTVAKVDERFEVRDALGTLTVPYPLERQYLYRWDCKQPLPITKDAKWGFLGTDGRLLFDPPRHETLHDFNDGHAAVKENGKWGIIDLAGRYTVESQFDELSPIRSGLFKGKLNGVERIIDATGSDRPEPRPVRPDPAVAFQCGGGLRIIRDGGKSGLGFDDGRILVPPVHRAVTCFREGIAWLPDEANRLWCPIGVDGQRKLGKACEPFKITGPLPYATSATPRSTIDVVLGSFLLDLETGTPVAQSRDPFEASVQWNRALFDYVLGARSEPPPTGPAPRPRW